MLERIGPGSLKCVTASSAEGSLRERLDDVLRAHVDADDIRHLYREVFLVYTDADTAAIRDWLTPCLGDGDSVFVVEFERWSGYGPAPDRRWLLRRGH